MWNLWSRGPAAFPPPLWGARWSTELSQCELPCLVFEIRQCFKCFKCHNNKLTEEYSHLKFIKESNNEADKAGEQVQFWGFWFWRGPLQKVFARAYIWFELSDFRIEYVLCQVLLAIWLTLPLFVQLKHAERVVWLKHHTPAKHHSFF